MRQVDDDTLGALIQYRCVQREHLGGSADDRVFLHQAAWAFCPAGRRAGDHKMIPTGGMERRRLENGSWPPRRA